MMKRKIMIVTDDDREYDNDNDNDSNNGTIQENRLRNLNGSHVVY